MTYHAMCFFWALSEKHWFLRPFEKIGDFLEDWGFKNGHIVLSDKVEDAIRESRKEYYERIGINGLWDENE